MERNLLFAASMVPQRSKQVGRALAVLGACLAIAGCSKHGDLAEPAAPLSVPARLCSSNEGPPVCRSAADLDRLLAGDLEILGMDDTPSGSQGAKILTVRSRPPNESVVFRVRWRAQSTSGLINEPRKELAAYAVQKLFLDADEIVAPPTAAHCFPLAEYRRFAPDEKASFAHLDCVLGFATYWLEGVKTVEGAREDDWLGEDSGILDEKRFDDDALYRASLARANLLTYLINHGDAHSKQFMLERTPRGLRAYVVDNSIAFLSIKNPMLLLREDWSKIQVPALPRLAITRLKELTERDLARLGTISELEIHGRQLSSRKDFDRAASAANDGSEMSWHGSRLRIGLTTGEIELVASRIRDLLARPDLDALAKL